MRMSSRPVSKPELLLPAGGMEAVVAAVQNGADAVYLGGKRFSARQNAENFDEEALKRAVRYCKTRGVKVYQTLNTLLFDGQLSEAEQAVRLSAPSPCSLAQLIFGVPSSTLAIHCYLRHCIPVYETHCLSPVLFGLACPDQGYPDRVKQRTVYSPVDCCCAGNQSGIL